jgi:hypothetical protein
MACERADAKVRLISPSAEVALPCEKRLSGLRVQAAKMLASRYLGCQSELAHVHRGLTKQTSILKGYCI